MLKLGFVYEGTLRRHAIIIVGVFSDSLVFAVTDVDWQHVKSVVIQERIKQNHLLRYRSKIKS